MIKIIHWLILQVRYLRAVNFFKHSLRLLIIFLMLVGAWVATRDLNIPPQYSLNDKLIHLLVFFAFAVLVDLSSGRKPFWLWKGLPLLVYGACIEIMQYFTPERSFSVFDWWADFIGIALYFMAKKLFIWLDRNKSSISE
jgi:VanZ family protein